MLVIAGVEKSVAVYENTVDVDAMLIKVGYKTISNKLNTTN